MDVIGQNPRTRQQIPLGSTSLYDNTPHPLQHCFVNLGPPLLMHETYVQVVPVDAMSRGPRPREINVAVNNLKAFEQRCHPRIRHRVMGQL